MPAIGPDGVVATEDSLIRIQTLMRRWDEIGTEVAKLHQDVVSLKEEGLIGGQIAETLINNSQEVLNVFNSNKDATVSNLGILAGKIGDILQISQGASKDTLSFRP